jgi:hypothetical protein
MADPSPVGPNPPCRPPKVARDDGKEEGEAKAPPCLGAPQRGRAKGSNISTRPRQIMEPRAMESCGLVALIAAM